MYIHEYVNIYVYMCVCVCVCVCTYPIVSVSLENPDQDNDFLGKTLRIRGDQRQDGRSSGFCIRSPYG